MFHKHPYIWNKYMHCGITYNWKMILLSNYVLHWIEYALESKFLQPMVYFVKIRQRKNNLALIVPLNSLDLISPQHFLQNAPSMIQLWFSIQSSICKWENIFRWQSHHLLKDKTNYLNSFYDPTASFMSNSYGSEMKDRADH